MHTTGYNTPANQQSLFYWVIMIQDRWFVVRPCAIWLIRGSTKPPKCLGTIDILFVSLLAYCIWDSLVCGCIVQGASTTTDHGGPPTTKLPARVEMVDGVLVDERLGNDGLDDVLDEFTCAAGRV